MGTDFLRNKRERHTKAWRQGMKNAASDMFAQVTSVKRVVRAVGEIRANLAPQQSVVLRLLPGGKVVATDGVHQVATVEKPSRALLSRLKLHQNAASGKVFRIYPHSGNLELQLED